MACCSSQLNESEEDMATKRPIDDKMDRKQGRSTDEYLNDCMERLNNDDRVAGDVYAHAWHLNCKKARKKLFAFLKHVKTSNKKTKEIKMEYNKCVEAIEKVITEVDNVMKVFNVRENTDQRDKKAGSESDKMDAEINQQLIKTLSREGTFFKDVKEQLKELQTCDMVEIRTDLKKFVEVMKAEKERNRPEVGEDCVKKYKHCFSSWKKSKSAAEKIKKILVGDDRRSQKKHESLERNQERQSMDEHSPRKQQRRSPSASLSDVNLTIENGGFKDGSTDKEPENDVKAMESEASLDPEKTRTEIKMQEDISMSVAKERQTLERTVLHHKGIGIQEVGNDIQALSPANESEFKKIKEEVENLEKELKVKENRIQELAGKLEEKEETEAKVVEKEMETKSDNYNVIRVQELTRKLEEKETEAKAIEKELKMNSDNYNRKIKELEDQKRRIEKEQKDNEGSRNRKIRELEGLVDKQKQQIEKEQREKKERERRLVEQIQETEAEQKKKEDALIRLSEMTSMQLRSNNPNIVDLSDLNRPTKIGEQLSELYDGDWTNAFEDLIKEKSERDAIKILHDIIMEAHTSCLGLSSIENMLKSIETDFLQGPSTIDVEVRQKLVDLRKRNALTSLENVTKKLKPDILSTLSDGSSSEALKKYVDACIKICWFMAVQDPPLRLYNIQRKEFDKEKYREYTQRGKYTDFVVWPALCLHEGGPLLAKGIAQGSKIPVEEKPPTPNALKPASTGYGAQVTTESPKQKIGHEEKQSSAKHVSSIPVEAPSRDQSTVNTNETKQQNIEPAVMMRPNKEENATSGTVSSDKQESSKQFVSTVIVSQTGNAFSSIQVDGQNMGSAGTVNNENKSANMKESAGHRKEMNATDEGGQKTKDDGLNVEAAVTKL